MHSVHLYIFATNKYIICPAYHIEIYVDFQIRNGSEWWWNHREA